MTTTMTSTTTTTTTESKEGKVLMEASRRLQRPAAEKAGPGARAEGRHRVFQRELGGVVGYQIEYVAR
jgi:hypothetical protein